MKHIVVLALVVASILVSANTAFAISQLGIDVQHTQSSESDTTTVQINLSEELENERQIAGFAHLLTYLRFAGYAQTLTTLNWHSQPVPATPPPRHA